jgi:hypothetical protein
MEHYVVPKALHDEWLDARKGAREAGREDAAAQAQAAQAAAKDAARSRKEGKKAARAEQRRLVGAAEQGAALRAGLCLAAGAGAGLLGAAIDRRAASQGCCWAAVARGHVSRLPPAGRLALRSTRARRLPPRRGRPARSQQHPAPCRPAQSRTENSAATRAFEERRAAEAAAAAAAAAEAAAVEEAAIAERAKKRGIVVKHKARAAGGRRVRPGGGGHGSQRRRTRSQLPGGRGRGRGAGAGGQASGVLLPRTVLPVLCSRRPPPPGVRLPTASCTCQPHPLQSHWHRGPATEHQPACRSAHPQRSKSSCRRLRCPRTARCWCPWPGARRSRRWRRRC